MLTFELESREKRVIKSEISGLFIFIICKKYKRHAPERKDQGEIPRQKGWYTLTNGHIP